MGLRRVVRSTIGCLFSPRHISAELSEEAKASDCHTSGPGPVVVTQRVWSRQGFARLVQSSRWACANPHSAYEGVGQVPLHPLERTRGCLWRFRH